MAVKYKCYTNREISWLKFNERVLNEAGNSRVPLGERLNFTSIYQSNLDEFFMVRVGTLMDQVKSGEIVRDNKTNMTSAEQVDAIMETTRNLYKKEERYYKKNILELSNLGISLVEVKSLSDDELSSLETYFDYEVAPFLSPMIVGKQQPFPFIESGELYMIVVLINKNGKSKLSVTPCSNKAIPRLVEVSSKPGTFVLLENLILYFAPKLFKKHTVKEKSIIRVTRNGDIDADTLFDEDLEYRNAMANLIRARKRLSPVRLEITKGTKVIPGLLSKYLDLPQSHVFVQSIPLDMSFMTSLRKMLQGKEGVFFEKVSPHYPLSLERGKPIIPQIESKDILIAHPYESGKPIITMLREASADDTVVSIKMTLYRLADESKIAEALMEAAENGKDVVVLMELRARFDEENNLEWSKALEDAGCQVFYGLEKYKVHSKLCLITRKTNKGLSYITHIGTGNYNEKTMKLYTDLSLMTSNISLGAECAKIFNDLLMGEVTEESQSLLVAPKCLQNKVMEFIDEEIQHAKDGEPAYIGLKLNSLTDKTIINGLIEASKAGVKIEMIVRGICCMIPGIEGETENITIISIVGRYLEHSRIYRFGVGDRERIFISSADFMTRNTLRRVELAAPIYDEVLKDRLRFIFDTAMKDDDKGKIQNSEGIYENRRLGRVKLNSQELFSKMVNDHSF